jgi:uncharacterized membrane protein
MSPILLALAEAEEQTTGKIRVHLSRRWIERRPFERAAAIFREFEMSHSRHRNSVLIYLNLRRRKFAIVADASLTKNVSQRFWDKVARELAVDLRSTHFENAVAAAVRRIGEAMKKHYPSPQGEAGS